MTDKVKKLEAEYVEARMAALRARQHLHSVRCELLRAMIDQGNDEYEKAGIHREDLVLASYPDGTSEYLLFLGFVEVRERLAVKRRFVKFTPGEKNLRKGDVTIPNGTELSVVSRCVKGKS